MYISADSEFHATTLFLRYGGDVDALADAVADYLDTRVGNEASISYRWCAPEPTQEYSDAKQRAQDSMKLYEEALQAIEATKKEIEDVKQAF
jgi:hypothetical protein